VLVRAFDFDGGGPRRFGQYKLAFYVSTTAIGLLGFGLTASLFYFVPRQKGDGHRYIVNAVVALSLVGIAAAIGVTAFRFEIASLLNSPALVHLLPLVGLLVLFSLPGDMVLSLPIIDRRPVLAAWIMTGTDLLRAGSIIFAALVFRSVTSVVWVAAIVAGLRLTLLLIYVPLRRSGDAESARFNGTQLKAQFGYALPFALAVLFERALQSVHAFWVSSQVPDAVFALYAAGVFQVPVIKGFIASIAEVIIVRTSAVHKSGDTEELSRLWQSATGLIVVVLVPIMAVCEVMAPDIIGLIFGPDYVGAVPIFRVFLVGMLLYMIIDHAILRATGDTQFLIWSSAAGFVVSLLSLFVLTRFDLMLGAVSAFVLGLTVTRVMGLIRVASQLELEWTQVFPFKKALQAAFTAGLASLVVLLGLRFVHGHFLRLAVGGPALLGIYGALAWTFRLLPRAEVAALASRFDPRNAVRQAFNRG